MPTGAPLPVREYGSVAEMKAHYAAVLALRFAPRPATVVVLEPELETIAEPEPVAEDEAPKVDLFVERTLAEFGPTVLPDTHEQRDGRATLRGYDCLKIVAQITGFSAAAMQGPRRIADLVKARQIAMWLLANRAGKSLSQAGWLMGGRDHTTALHACRRVKAMMRAAGIADAGESADLVAMLWAAEMPALRSDAATMRRARPCA